MATSNSYAIHVDPVEELPSSDDISAAVEEVIEDMRLQRVRMTEDLRIKTRQDAVMSVEEEYTLRLRERRLVVDIAFITSLILGALMVAYVYALFVVVEGEVQKQTIIDVVEEVTGRKMIINGRLKFEGFPFPKFRVNDVRLLNTKEADSGTLVSIRSFEVEPSVIHMLLGSVKIANVALTGLDVNIENFLDKKRTYGLNVSDKEAVEIKEVMSFLKSFGGQFDFDKMTINNLAVRFFSGYSRDPIERVITLQKLSFREGEGNVLYNILGEVYFRDADITYDFNAAVESRDEIDVYGVNLRAVTGASNVNFTGDLDFSNGELMYQADIAGVFEGSMQNIRKYFDDQSPLLSDMISGLFVGDGVNVSGKMRLDSQRLSIRKLSMDDPNLVGTMDLDLDFSDVLLLKLDLNYDKVQIDSLIAQSSQADILSRSEIIVDNQGGRSNASTNVTDIGLPDDIDLIVRARLNEVFYNEKKIKGIKLDMEAGEITAIRSIEIKSFPGGSSLRGGGELLTQGGGLVFDGRLNILVKSVPDLLAWWGQEVEQHVDLNALQDFSIDTAMHITQSEILFKKVSMSIDGNPFLGRLSVSKDDGFVVKSSLRIDKLDIDKYYTKASNVQQDLNAEYALFEFLRYIDNVFQGFTFAVNVKELKYQGRQYNNFSTVANFQDGISELTGIRFDYEGEPVRGSVKLDNRQLNPEIVMIFDITRMDMVTLLSFFMNGVEDYNPSKNIYLEPFIFDFSRYNLIRGKISLNIKEMQVNKAKNINFERVRVDVGLMNDGVKLERFSAKGLGGNVRLTGELETVGRILGHVNYYLTNVNVKTVLKALLGIESIEGKVNTTGQVAVSGSTFRQWIRTMSGKGDVVSRGITLYGFDLDFLLKTLPKTRKSIRHVRFVVNKALSSGSSKLDFASATYNFFQGNIVLGQSSLTGDKISRSYLTGNIDMIDWSIDTNYSFTASGEGRNGYAMKAHIVGPLQRPAVRWNEKEIVKRWEDSQF